MLKVFQVIFIIISFAAGYLVEAQKEPHFKGNRSAIVHLFEWTWKDIAKECEEFLGPEGYGGVQISPPNEVRVIEGQPWWARYQPISYTLISRSGNEADLADMIARCHRAHVVVYADIVMNHMSAFDAGDSIGTAGSHCNYKKRLYPGVPYGPEDFHTACDIKNYQNPGEVRNCQLNTLLDLNQTNPHVRDAIVGYMNKLIDMGVAGFRIDAAKHMWPSDLQIIYGRLKPLNAKFGFPKTSWPYIYQEVIDLGGESIKKTEYSPLAAVTEFKFSAEIGRMFRGKNSMKYLRNWGPQWNMLPTNDTVVFVDNHDNQRGHGAGGADILSFQEPALYKLAAIFMLAHPGWVCEHRWFEIQQMVRFRNFVANEPLRNWWEWGENQIAFSRGNLGFVIFNMEKEKDLKATLNTGLPPGIYCDILTGLNQNTACSGEQIVVDKEGKAVFSGGKGPKAWVLSKNAKL